MAPSITVLVVGWLVALAVTTSGLLVQSREPGTHGGRYFRFVIVATEGAKQNQHLIAMALREAAEHLDFGPGKDRVGITLFSYSSSIYIDRSQDLLTKEEFIRATDHIVERLKNLSEFSSKSTSLTIALYYDLGKFEELKSQAAKNIVLISDCSSSNPVTDAKTVTDASRKGIAIRSVSNYQQLPVLLRDLIQSVC